MIAKSDLYDTHARYDREVERASIALDALERSVYAAGQRLRYWREAGSVEYQEIESCFFDLYWARSSLDDDVLALPIERWEHVEQKLAIVRRVTELEPERDIELRRRVAKQIAAWTAQPQTIAA